MKRCKPTRSNRCASGALPVPPPARQPPAARPPAQAPVPAGATPPAARPAYTHPCLVLAQAQTGAPSLTVRQYADAAVQKYLRGGFSSADPAANLAQAAEVLYELQRQLRLRGKTPRDSEDGKAALKSIRDAIDTLAYNSAEGVDSASVDQLFELYAQLEEVCEQKMAAGSSERVVAAEVQESLRYRLTRLVSTDQWEGSPKLKLRVLKLMFRFMIRENERILAAGSRAFGPAVTAAPVTPSGGGRLGRTASGKRGGAAAAAAAPYSRWGEAINELSRMPGSRMFPLLKLCVMENMHLSAAAEEAAEEAAAAAASAEAAVQAAEASRPSVGTPTAGAVLPGAEAGSEAPTSPYQGAIQGERSAAESHAGSTAPAPATPATLARAGRLREAPPPPPPRQKEAARTQGKQGAEAEAAQQPAQQPAQQQQQLPPPSKQQQQQEGQQAGAQFSLDDLLGLLDEPAPHPAPQPPHQVPYHHSAPLPQGPSPSAAPMPAEQLFAAFDAISPAASTGFDTITPTAGAGGAAAGGNPFSAAAAEAPGAAVTLPAVQRQGSSPTRVEPSPYFGVPNPFGDARFTDLAPNLQAARPPQTPTAQASSPGPPMRFPSTSTK